MSFFQASNSSRKSGHLWRFLQSSAATAQRLPAQTSSCPPLRIEASNPRVSLLLPYWIFSVDSFVGPEAVVCSLMAAQSISRDLVAAVDSAAFVVTHEFDTV